MKSFIAIAGLAVAGLLCGCQSAPLSYVSGQPGQPLPPDEYPLRVVSVDQQLYFSEPVQLTPGSHSLVFELPLPGSHALPQKTLQYDIAPCTRYVFVGQRRALAKPDFELLLKRQEAVAGCQSAQELSQAAAAQK